MGVLNYRMISEVFLFLSAFDKWKSAKVIVVIFPWRWLILSRVENPDMCVRVSCAAACISHKLQHKLHIITKLYLFTNWCTSELSWKQY